MAEFKICLHGHGQSHLRYHPELPMLVLWLSSTIYFEMIELSGTCIRKPTPATLQVLKQFRTRLPGLKVAIEAEAVTIEAKAVAIRAEAVAIRVEAVPLTADALQQLTHKLGAVFCHLAGCWRPQPQLCFFCYV